MSGTLDNAVKYLSQGWMPIPVPPRSKNPNRKGWQNEKYSQDDLPRAFANGANIGLLLGEPSGGLVDIDLDCDEARNLAEPLLPNTDMTGGRASTPHSHRWYICNPPPKTTNFLDPSTPNDERAMIVELRSTGGQTLVPPSIHPSGEAYKWDGGLAPATVDGNMLMERVSKLAACALVARHWKRGQRNQTALALSGTLLRAGWDRQKVENFIRLAATTTGDEEVDNRVRVVATTEERLKSGEQTTGLPSLADLLGEKVVNCLRQWLALSIQAFEPFDTSQGQVSADNDDWPDLEPLPVGLLPVPQMSDTLLPKSFRPWLCDIAERMQCPLDFPAIGALVALSSVVGDRIAIHPKRHDDWTVIPNLWGAVIGRPGVLKSPALDEAIRPLKRLAVEASEEYQRALKEGEFERLRIEAEKKNLKENILKSVRKGDEKTLNTLRQQLDALEDRDPPIERRFIVNDSTVEKLGELLNQNPHGLLLFRDELTGWLRNLDREGREGDRAFYLEAWAGHGRFTYDRIGRGTLHIESVTISILGGIQPGPLSQYLRSALSGGIGDDGLLQRFQLLIYPDQSGNWRNVDRYPDTESKNRAFEIFQRLANLDAKKIGALQDDDSHIPAVRFGDEAQELFNSWRKDLETELRSNKLEHPALEAHLSKYRSLMPSLALLFHLIDVVDGRTEETLVTYEAAAKAAAWCSYLFEHARRVYGLAIYATAHLAKSLGDHIIAGDLPNPFTARDVYLKHWAGLGTPKDVAEPLSLLTDLNWLRAVTVQTGGRPTQYYYINPKVSGAPK